MLPSKWLENFLVDHIGQNLPDGRPLYAYKCNENAYEELKTIVQAMFQEYRSFNYYPIGFEPLLCLFAAETWRRRHTGGPWAWETVFSEISQTVPAHQYRSRYIRNGLRFWKRRILQNRYGHNEYLVTIACEGGLPLLLLQNENAKLYQYFRNLMERYNRERQNPRRDIFDLAEIASDCLPQSLHRHIVYKLSSDLVEKIVELQEKVQNSVEPINALNQLDPNWRDQLPLPIEDHTAELLLKNLVHDAQKISIKGQKLRWRRFLSRKGNQWTVEQELEIPKTFLGSTLQQWFNKSEIPMGLRFFLQTDKKFEPIALITRLKGEGQDAIYRCETLKRYGVHLYGEAILDNAQIIVSDGISEKIVHAQSGQDWGPLPWAFAERNGQWDYIGEGTVRCKESTVRVLMPRDGAIENQGAEISQIGEAAEFQRELFKISGTIVWRHPELGTCRIQCANPDAKDEAYFLWGNKLPGVADQNPPFLGVPRLLAMDSSGLTRPASGEVTAEWRPHGAVGAEWCEDSSSCAGEVWLRYANAQEEHILYRKARIVPETTTVKAVRIGSNENPGVLRLTGLANVQVYIDELSGCRFRQRYDQGWIEIDCFADSFLSTTHFSAVIFWPDGRALTLHLPLPRVGASFVYAEEALPAGERVPIDKLATIQAVAQAPAETRRFYLTIQIETGNAALRNHKINIPLRFEEGGKSTLLLHRIQDQITSLLALTGELDAFVKIEVVDSSDRSLAGLEVGRFDENFEPERENGRIVLSQNCRNRLEIGWEERVSVRMIRLWEPAAEPVVLKIDDGGLFWAIPEGLEPGPWWILGEDGAWARFRPLLWVVPGEPAALDSPLKKAILTGDHEARNDLLIRWAEQIAMDPQHDDWSLFFEYLDLVQPYPASALDLFRYVARSPESLVMALIKSSEERFNAIWSLSYQLPFSWYLLPARAWLVSAKRYFSSMRVALSEIGSADGILWEHFISFRERLTVRRPFFRQICDWLCQPLFPDRVLENSELALAKSSPETVYHFIREEEQSFQGRHDPDERYPEGSQTMRITEQPDFPTEQTYRRLSDHLRPVRCAPFVATHISLHGLSYDEALLFELKRFRDFDRVWFNGAFAFALCLGLSQMPPD